jgi:hypothetical protein
MPLNLYISFVLFMLYCALKKGSATVYGIAPPIYHAMSQIHKHFRI